MNTYTKFSAAWCKPCSAMDEQLKALGLYQFIDVYDIDKHPDKIQTHSIRSLPTLIKFKDGVEVSRLVGSKTSEQLKEFMV